MLKVEVLKDTAFELACTNNIHQQEMYVGAFYKCRPL